MVVLKRRWCDRVARQRPYPWLSTGPGELCSRRIARDLAMTFPTGKFARVDRSDRSSGKRYRNYSRPITWPADEHEFEAPWCSLVTDVLSPEYRMCIARLLSQQPAAALELRLVQHASGDWLGPHADRPDKLFTHVIYFNMDWQESWGGCFECLRSRETNSVVMRVVPELGVSVLLSQASDAWHQVTKVSPDAASPRRSLLIHGLRP